MTWKNFKMDASAAYNKRVSTNDHGPDIAVATYTTW